MRRLAIASVAVALALLTFYEFPGHTWLQQDTQIYVPILEHLKDPSVLRNDILAQQPHVRFTVYDETARFLSGLTGRGFREVLQFEQVATRAIGIWGLYLCATAIFGAGAEPLGLLLAAICSLGISITGPQVLTFEYEPTPRAFAIPLLLCAIGLAAHRRYLGAGIAGAVAFSTIRPRRSRSGPFTPSCCSGPANGTPCAPRLRGLIPLVCAAAVMTLAEHAQSGGGEIRVLFGRLTLAEEQLQRLRSPYLWVSGYPAGLIWHYVILFLLAVAAYVRLRREIPPVLRVFLLGLPAIGMLSMPISWLLLDQWKWALVPQVQPLRMLLFVALAMQFLTAAAGAWAATRRRFPEAVAWFALAFLLPVHPVITNPLPWARLALVIALALLAAAAVRYASRPGLRWAPALVLVAFFAIPGIGGGVNYPKVDTPELAQLADWARTSTPGDAVFVFPDAGRAVYPGVFRSEALRAVYVDWKGGGQANFLRGLGEQWWFRWQQTGAGRFNPRDMQRFEAFGINYVVLRAQDRLPQPATFQNSGYAVYRVR